jgi:hypothetical protein
LSLRILVSKLCELFRVLSSTIRDSVLKMVGFMDWWKMGLMGRMDILGGL